MKFKQILPQENEYLQILDTIAVKPKLLYYYGEWPEERVKTVAIVGARHNSKYGAGVAYELAKEVGKRGAIVVSGLAYGIDSIAARGALDGGGRTIAFLGTAIERIYPAQHIPLAKEIVEKGGVVASEYKEGAELIPPKVSFLQRNRLISGVADVVVVVEAAEKSGTLNTASHALAQGKELFAVPGDITKELSAGCNRLIFNGANPLVSIPDFLDYLFPVESKQKTKRKKRDQISLFAPSSEERRVLEAIMRGVRDGDEIMEELKMPVATFNQTITILEIKGAVRALGYNQWEIKPS